MIIEGVRAQKTRSIGWAQKTNYLICIERAWPSSPRAFLEPVCNIRGENGSGGTFFLINCRNLTFFIEKMEQNHTKIILSEWKNIERRLVFSAIVQV